MTDESEIRHYWHQLEVLGYYKVRSQFKQHCTSQLQDSARNGFTKWIHLLAPTFEPIVKVYMYVSLVLSSCHPKANKLLDTSLSPHSLPSIIELCALCNSACQSRP